MASVKDLNRAVTVNEISELAANRAVYYTVIENNYCCHTCNAKTHTHTQKIHSRIISKQKKENGKIGDGGVFDGFGSDGEPISRQERTLFPFRRRRFRLRRCLNSLRWSRRFHFPRCLPSLRLIWRFQFPRCLPFLRWSMRFHFPRLSPSPRWFESVPAAAAALAGSRKTGFFYDELIDLRRIQGNAKLFVLCNV
ncbi:hypothetical protein MIMGU_mgv11b015761mg [Erythranthe guttata]|uniref:Uncharacterized protein n=1 Tax=Erythranthe guttata TaxID=4155 RepID=A0A022QMM6_ERYGU|nr:hypothetical protein MIMGU_mgv11b015761mg [Erythranthe guttata]